MAAMACARRDASLDGGQRDAGADRREGGVSSSGDRASSVLDLRTYKLVRGGRRSFDQLFREGALPMLNRHGIRVVGYGPSLVDEDHYYLARAFSSPSSREEQLEGLQRRVEGELSSIRHGSH